MNKLNYKNIFIFFVLIPGILGLCVFYITKNGINYNFVSTNHKIASTTDEVLANISRLMVLPENERAAVATIHDLSKLKDQVFFVNAKKGYKVIIYQTNRKAILYDPFEDKIVEVSSINLTTTAGDIVKVTEKR